MGQQGPCRCGTHTVCLDKMFVHGSRPRKQPPGGIRVIEEAVHARVRSPKPQLPEQRLHRSGTVGISRGPQHLYVQTQPPGRDGAAAMTASAPEQGRWTCESPSSPGSYPRHMHRAPRTAPHPLAARTATAAKVVENQIWRPLHPAGPLRLQLLYARDEACGRWVGVVGEVGCDGPSLPRTALSPAS
eukprot:scaffold88489_cov35-Tisochrysis_lutea.AAC.1